MKIALLGTGFEQAHTVVYAEHPDVDEVGVFGRTPNNLATIGGQFGFATPTDLSALLADPSVDLVDICLPTQLHADIAIRAMQAAGTCTSSCRWPSHSPTPTHHRRPLGRRAFVDMLSRFSPANGRPG